MTTTATPLAAVEPEKKRKSQQELEIERLTTLSPTELTSEDMRKLGRIRDCRSSLLEIERKLEEVKETRKLRQSELDLAILQASMHFDNRQLALKFDGQ